MLVAACIIQTYTQRLHEENNCDLMLCDCSQNVIGKNASERQNWKFPSFLI